MVYILAGILLDEILQQLRYVLVRLYFIRMNRKYQLILIQCDMSNLALKLS